MGQRAAVLYSHQDAQSMVTSLRGLFQHAGISLVKPGSDRVFILDNEGEQISTTEADMFDLLRKRNETQFQWWLAEDHDVYCRVRKTNDIIAVELGLEGLTGQEQALVKEALLACCRRTAHLCLGFVFDPDGKTEEYDWDAFFVRGESL